MKNKAEEMEAEGFNDFDNMSDEELQEALAAGVLKPGLNVACEEREFKNNIKGLNLKLADLTQNLNWIERLDLIVKPAPIAPEAHAEATKEETSNVAKLKNRVKFNELAGTVAVMDDFKREMLFHRQAQSAVLEGIKRLKSLKIPTKRPDDYFAEMAKSDEHMHKVRQNLAARQTAAARSEKLSQLRRLKKLGKQTQIENKLKQASEKRKMLNEVKRYKKGLRKDLNFLDGKPDLSDKQTKQKNKIPKKRAQRNEKFGFGGKKRGLKKNTKESLMNIGSSARKGKKSSPSNNKRLGKSRRIKKKARK